MVFTNHETRDTNHGLGCGAAWAAMARHGRHIAPAPASLPRPPFSVASRRSPFAAVPVALRAHAAVANAKGTHVEKGERSGLHKQGNFRYRVDTPGMIPGSVSGRRFALRSGVGRTPEPCTAGRPRRLGCGRRAGFFTMLTLTRRREPRRQEPPRKSRTLFQDSP